MGTKISALPAAGAITGAELVPVDQGGVTVQTTTGATGAINPVTAAETAAGLTPVNFRQPSDQSLIQALRYNASTSWDYRTDQRLFEIYLSKYGAVFNGTSDDGPALADAINAIYSAGTRRRVIMPSGNLTAKINSGLPLYCGALGIDFNGLILDATGISSGNVLTLNGNGASPYSRSSDSLPYENFVILGDTTAGNTATLISAAGSSTYPGEISGAVLRNFALYGGAVGISLGENLYLFFVENFRILNALSVGLDVPAGATAGENVCFRAGQISNTISGSNTGLGIRLQATANDYGIRMQNVSIDYNDQAFEVLGGQLFFDNCYIEMNNTANPVGAVTLTGPAVIAGATFMGGEIALSDTTAARVNVLTVAGGAATRIKLLGTRVASNGTPTAQIVNVTDGGASTVDVQGVTIDNFYKGSSLAGPLNRLYNGGFETGSLAGWNDTGSSGYTWVVNTANPHSGTYALEITSTGTSASGSIVSGTVPVRPGQQILSDAWLDVTALTAGSVEAIIEFAADTGFSVNYSSVVACGEFTATTSAYTEGNYSGVVPSGVNYARMAIACNGTFTGTVYADDFKLATV